jgi:hypothetical protein
MLFSPGRQVLVGLYWRRDSIENISNEKRRRIHEYLSFRAAVKTDAGTAAAAHTDGSKVRFARYPPTCSHGHISIADFASLGSAWNASREYFQIALKA